MAEHTIVDLMGTTMTKIRDMVDVDTIIGKPITTPDGVTIIPVSKLTFGFGTGGTDYSGKNPSPIPNFGGGSGAGVSISPIAFLIISGETVKLLPVSSPVAGPVDRVIEAVPTVLEKIQEFLSRRKKDEDED